MQHLHLNEHPHYSCAPPFHLDFSHPNSYSSLVMEKWYGPFSYLALIPLVSLLQCPSLSSCSGSEEVVISDYTMFFSSSPEKQQRFLHFCLVFNFAPLTSPKHSHCLSSVSQPHNPSQNSHHRCCSNKQSRVLIEHLHFHGNRPTNVSPTAFCILIWNSGVFFHQKIIHINFKSVICA